VIKRLPFFKVLAIAQIALMVRRHLRNLDPIEHRRLRELVFKAHRMEAHERRELRDLVAKLEPMAFAVGAADKFSPVSLRRFTPKRK
jgi:hypothetical protein